MNTSKNTRMEQKKLAIVLHSLQGNCLSNEHCFMHGFLQEMCYRLYDQQEALLHTIPPSDTVILDFPLQKKERKELN